jgi:hypothetical protein
VSRLWERRAEVYEFVLCQGDWWKVTRAEAVRKVGRDEVTVVTPPEPIADNLKWQRSWVRLQMYGERSVREAFERCFEADKKFLIAFIAWHAAAELNLKAAREEVPGHQAVDGAELVRLRKAVESANDSADAQQEKLVAVTAKAVGRLPRYERRAWRGLKKPPMG